MRKLFAVCLVSVTTAQLWACSGPGALGEMIEADGMSLILFGIELICFVFSIRIVKARKATGPFIFQIAMLAINPLWTVSAYSGDCGSGKEGTSILVFVGICIAALYGRTRPLREPKTQYDGGDYPRLKQ